MTMPAPTSTRQEKHTRPARYARPDVGQLRNWLWEMFGSNEGWLDLGYIEGDPKERPMTRDGWHYYNPNDLDDLAERCCALVEQYGNAYHSIGLYREPRRAIEALSFLPGIFVDDYPGRATRPATCLLETSQRNYQAFWLVPGGIDAATFHALGQAVARATGGGPNSCNAAHMIRFPGSINTKPGKGSFAARYHANPSYPRYNVEQLRAAFPQAKHGPNLVLAELDNETREDIEYWRANIDSLLKNGIPKRMVPRPGRQPGQTYNILRGIQDVPGDGSSSMWRATLMRGLLLHGYPMAEAIALAMHLAPPARTQSDTWLFADCVRLFGKAQDKLGPKYKPTASRPNGKSSPVKNTETPTEPPRPRGRPLTDTLSADVLYAWFCDNAVGTPAKVIGTVDDVAAEFNVPRSQVERAERELRKRGLIKRGWKRHTSWVELPHFRPCKNPPRTKGRAVPAPMPKSDESEVQCKERGCTGETHPEHTHPTGGCVSPQTPPAQAQASASTSTLRLREPASVVERRERQARLRELNPAELEQRRDELRRQARRAYKPWERRELEAQAREVEAELGHRRDESLDAMFALGGEQEADRLILQPEAAPAQRACSEPPVFLLASVRLVVVEQPEGWYACEQVGDELFHTDEVCYLTEKAARDAAQAMVLAQREWQRLCDGSLAGMGSLDGLE